MEILGVRLDLLSREEALRTIEGHLTGASQGLCAVTTVNAECVDLAAGDPDYRQILAHSSLNLIDSAGVAWIARLRGYGPRQRIPGSDLIYDLARLCQSHGQRLFLLGAAPTVAAAAALRLPEMQPGLEVESYSPPLTPSDRLPPAEEETIFRRLAALSPRVLCVALGMPKQERWVHRHRQRLEEVGVRVVIGVGGALDYLAGAVPRAPAWMRAVGLEWLYRLLRQPRRRFRRQATRLPRFLVLASLEALRLRLRGEKPGHP
jgi:N-acetylglucosaminyldiphosphoundecaprenol N-acetyl-beta-D-mannosaminyltransferase